jgi:PAS domain S-box-containing protein
MPNGYLNPNYGFPAIAALYLKTWRNNKTLSPHTMTPPTPLTSQPSGPMPSSNAMLKRLVTGTMLINFFLFSLAGLSIYQSRQQHEERAEITTQNLARVLDENIDGAIKKIDIALLSVQDEVKRQIAGGGIDAKTLNAFLAQQQDHQPEILSLRATDEKGIVKYGRGVPTTGGPNNSDREYYLRARDEAQPGLIVAKPFIARIDKKWVIVFARRLNKPDGSFAGVVYAPVELAHLSKTFSEIDVGPRGIITLRDSELGIVIRHPEPQGTGSVIGQQAAPQPLREMVQAGRNAGTYLADSTVDGIERTFSYRKVAGKPFYIIAGMAVNDYLAGWWKDTIKIAGLAALFFVATLISSWLLYRSWKRQAAAAETMATSEANLRLAQAVSHIGSWHLNLEGSGLVWSEETYLIFGLARGTPLSYKDFLTCVHPDDRDAVNATWQAALKGKPYDITHRIVVDGRIKWVREQAELAIDNTGQMTSGIGTVQDITAQMLMEQELKRSNAELEQFSYAISHDMRQPLRMISSYLQLLEKSLGDQLDGDKRDYFHYAVDGAQRLDQMLVALLEYSRVGRKGEPPQWVESRSLLDEALQFLQPAITEAQAAVTISGDWPRIFVSSDEITRLIQNLIGNAVKYRVTGRKPEIAVTSEIAGKEWLLSVADNGVGILPDQAHRLFQVFQRLHTRAAYEGTGIGLALCRKIVEHHGGRIVAESPGEGQGSAFRVFLPLPQKEVEEAGGAEQAGNCPSEASAGIGVRS